MFRLLLLLITIFALSGGTLPVYAETEKAEKKPEEAAASSDNFQAEPQDEKSEKQRKFEEIKKHVDGGFRAYQTRDYETAVQEWKKALEINPDLVYLYSNIGMAYHFLGKDEETLDYWLKYAELRPKDAHIYNNLGNFYKDKEEYQKALEYFQKAAELVPTYHMPHYNSGLTYLQLKEYSKAIESFNKAYESNPQEKRVFRYLCEAYRMKGEPEKALEYCEKALTVKENLSENRYEYLLTLIVLDKNKEALEMVKRLMEEDPDFLLKIISGTD